MTARPPGGPRNRYIGFRVEAEQQVPRQALIAAIRRTADQMDPSLMQKADPWLTRYDGTLGILRCRHTHVDDTRTLLDRLNEARVDDAVVPVKITALATSGTIRSLTDKPLKELRDTGKRR